MTDAHEVFRRDAVDVARAISELRKRPSSGKDRPDIDAELNEDDSFNLPIEEIPDAMSPSRDQAAVKMLLRSHNLDPLREERKLYWRSIYLRMEAAMSTSFSSARTTSISDAEALVDATTQLYKETVMTCFGTMELPSEEPPLPHCVNESQGNTYYLSEAGRISVARILTCFAYNAPDVRYCPMLYPLAAIIRHYLSEEDTYGLLTNLVKSKRTKFVFETDLQYDVAWRVAHQLSYKFTKKSINFIVTETSQEEVEELFQDWIWWIFKYLPFAHVVRIMDTFLFEGYKVLYRICYSIIHHFAKRARVKTSSMFSLNDKGLQTAFRNFLKSMPMSPNELLERGFKIRGFSKTTLQRASIHIEVDIKAGKAKNLARLSAKAIKRTRSQSPDNLPTPQDVQRIQSASTTINYKEGQSTPQPARKNPEGAFPIHNLKSELLSKQDLVTLWHWIPDRMTMATPVLAYSSNEHGLSMQTFYTMAEKYEPTILVIKTTNQEIFGAYCSTTWAQRNIKNENGQRQTYFGTGETFIFSFSVGPIKDGDSKATPTFYPWVKTGKNTNEETTGTKAENHAKELFMCGQHDMFAIGGGEGNAIFVDSSLTNGRTERCATFNNPPLCKEGDFQIAAIEVFGLFRLEEF